MPSVPRIRSGYSLRRCSISARADCVTKCLVNDGAPCPDASPDPDAMRAQIGSAGGSASQCSALD